MPEPRYLSPEHVLQPPGQKFPIGARVRILDTTWKHLGIPEGTLATVLGSYNQHCCNHRIAPPESQDLRSYSLYVDGHGGCSWFAEEDLELIG